MKTAVEWLFEEFTKTNHLTEDEFYMKFQQAKEMEKKQNKAAYERGKKYKKPLKDSNPIKW